MAFAPKKTEKVVEITFDSEALDAKLARLEGVTVNLDKSTAAAIEAAEKLKSAINDLNRAAENVRQATRARTGTIKS